MTSPTFWVQIGSSGGLSKVDRINEILFGLIMVLTFTCSISAATDGKEEVSTILWSALGCNVAWGLVDALMYLFSVLIERGESYNSIKMIQEATTKESTTRAIRNALPPTLSHILKEDHIDFLSQEIRSLPAPPAKVRFTLKDLLQSAAIFLLVFLSTFPVTLPFLFINELAFALRISNGIALILLFLTGVYLAKETGRRRILTGVAFALIGSVLVAVTMALGG